MLSLPERSSPSPLPPSLHDRALDPRLPYPHIPHLPQTPAKTEGMALGIMPRVFKVMLVPRRVLEKGGDFGEKLII